METIRIAATELRYMPTSTLIPYINNARTHPAEQIEQLRRSLREFGFVTPILIDSQGNVIAGHGRLLAAQAEGMSEVPCVIASELTDEQRRAYILADNRLAETSSWDPEILKIEMQDLMTMNFDLTVCGWAEDDIEKLTADALEAEPEAEEDDYEPEPPEEPTAQPGDVYQLGRHRLMCGDSTSTEDVQTLLGGVQTDLLVTDPPYGVDYKGTAGKIKNDNLADEAFDNFLTAAFSAAYSGMKPGAAFYIWYASSKSHNFTTGCRGANLEVKQELIWVKNSFNLGRQDYQWMHEPCLYGWKPGAAHYFTDSRTEATVVEDRGVDLKKLKKEEMLALLQQIYSDKTSTTIMHEDKPAKSAEHPTMKPVKLIARLIKNSSRQGDKVLDVFGGSGTTLIACEQLNRDCCMMELDPRFVDVIIDRWEKLTGQKAEKIK